MFSGRRLCIATMHKKEQVIAPVLETALGVTCFTTPSLNTDLLGTFSGEVERTGNPLETARQKCIEAMRITGCDMAVSSEGSFGPHPVLGLLPSDEEFLYFIDQTNSLEIFVRELSTATNFSGEDIYSLQDLKIFAESALFPSHGLIMKDSQGRVTQKGISTWQQLKRLFNENESKGLPVRVETDMRAHFNPTRMTVIKTCAGKLVSALQSQCPLCNRPGFVVAESEPGLPCIECGRATSSVLKHIKICNKCNHKQELLYPYNKQFEEATYCDFCNP